MTTDFEAKAFLLDALAADIRLKVIKDPNIPSEATQIVPFKYFMEVCASKN